MTKPIPPRKPQTHFEQVPLDVVKKVIEEKATLEPPSKKTEPYSIRPDWSKPNGY